MVRVDHGTEACLTPFVQDYLKNFRGNVACQPYVQTRSKEVLKCAACTYHITLIYSDYFMTYCRQFINFTKPPA